MGTVLRARVVAGERGAAISAIEGVFSEVARLEAVLSTWRTDTELARVNAAPPGHPTLASTELVSLLAEAARWSTVTGGAFDPGIGALVDAWNLRGDPTRPAPPAIAAALEASGIARFELDTARRLVSRPARGWIDPGGFGKGAALREAGGVLQEAGVSAALLDFGGQLLAIGAPSQTDGWPVGVAHPVERAKPVAALRLREVSAATSSAGERGLHILDPRTGSPIPAWGSVTVIAADPLVADVLATALFVMGPVDALDWARRRNDIGVLVISRHESVVSMCWTVALERYLERPSTPSPTCYGRKEP